jgi:porin
MRPTNSKALRLSSFLLVSTSLFFVASAFADDDLQTDKMTGDWGGVRSDLEDKGISLPIDYIAEVAGNPDGGQRQGATYVHQIDFGIDADLQKAFGWDGFLFHINATDRRGSNLSDKYIGNLFESQELYGGGEITRLAQLSLEKKWFNGDTNLLVGRIFAGNDFAMSPLYCNFMTNAICLHPNSIPYDTPISLYPVATWGGRLKQKLDDQWTVQVGAFEANPSDNNRNGLNLSTTYATGEFSMAEVQYQPNWFGLPGTYKLGGYYDTSKNPDQALDIHNQPLATSTLPAKQVDGKSGGYFLAEQTVWSFEPSTKRGLTPFAGIHLADSTTSYFDWFALGGVVAQGIFPSRSDDKLSFGVAYGHVSPRRQEYQRDLQAATGSPQVIQSGETAMELNYGIQATPWLHLLPNIQYIINPGAVTNVPNAIVLGFELALQI